MYVSVGKRWSCYAFGMCGRAWQTITAADFRRLFQVELPEAFVPRYNLAPTQGLLLVLQDDQGRHARLASWGLRTSAEQPSKLSTFNARAATAPTSPLFGPAFRTRRALIPLSGVYEWTGGKGKRKPVGITRKDGRPVVCAGLWEELEGQTSCTILTTEPTGVFAEVHDRQPLLLPQDRWDAWLDPRTSFEDAKGLMSPNDLHRALHAYAVDPAVGNVRNDSALLSEPFMPFSTIPG
jgi:putative SOS response-associated peptidase YedK